MRWRAALISSCFALLGVGGLWVAAQEPKPVEWVENPKYLAWKDFPPGAWVTLQATYTTRRGGERSGASTRTWTQRLLSISPERLEIALTIRPPAEPGKAQEAGRPVRQEVERWVVPFELERASRPYGGEAAKILLDRHESQPLTIQGRRLDCDLHQRMWRFPSPRPEPWDARMRAGEMSLADGQESVWRSSAVPGGWVQTDRTDTHVHVPGPDSVEVTEVRLVGWGLK